MYVGWLQLGDRFVDGKHFEIINNNRAYAYIRDTEVCFVEEHDSCPTVALVMPTSDEYTGITTDPAPWYDPKNPDTAGFLGIIGIDVTGAEDSTRTAAVTQSITGGGVVGPLYHQAREMIVRGLAVAEDECSLQAGLTWLMNQTGLTADPCVGDVLTYFDCCPCICSNSGEPTTDCWVKTYRQLRLGATNDPVTGVPCEVDFWPTTYAELKKGPSILSETWCSWISIYRHLRLTGPPNWTCCVEQCVVPYMRQFFNVRITGGPTIIQKPHMNSEGALAVFEFTLVAANPKEQTVLQRAIVFISVGGGAPVPLDTTLETAVDPLAAFRTGGRVGLLAPLVEALAEEPVWLRESTIVTDPSPVLLSGSVAHIIRMTTAGEDSQSVRLMLEGSDGRTAEYLLPSLPAASLVIIDEQTRVATAESGGQQTNIISWLTMWDGSPITWNNLPSGDLTLIVDRVEGDTTEIIIEVLTASVAA